MDNKGERIEKKQNQEILPKIEEKEVIKMTDNGDESSILVKRKYKRRIKREPRGIKVRTQKKIKNQKKKKRQKKVKLDIRKFNNSLWTLQENICYRQFILENPNLFNTTRWQRKQLKINVQMSNYIKSRSPDQCRSHHQKMTKYHQNNSSIIEHIQNLMLVHNMKVQDPFLQEKDNVKQQVKTEEPYFYIPQPIKHEENDNHPIIFLSQIKTQSLY